jgi:hypothetical protein
LFCCSVGDEGGKEVFYNWRQIVARFEQKGFKLVAMKFMRASVDLLSKHYADLSKKPFFPELVRYRRSSYSYRNLRKILINGTYHLPCSVSIVSGLH